MQLRSFSASGRTALASENAVRLDIVLFATSASSACWNIRSPSLKRLSLSHPADHVAGGLLDDLEQPRFVEFGPRRYHQAGNPEVGEAPGIIQRHLRRS